MTAPAGSDPVRLDREQVASLARLLRQVEQFLDECDDSVEEALAAPFGLRIASSRHSVSSVHRENCRLGGLVCAGFGVLGLVGGGCPR